MKETKEDRFRRVATRRMNNLLKELRRLSQCGNKVNYAHTRDEVNRMFGVIDHSVKEAQNAFERIGLGNLPLKFQVFSFDSPTDVAETSVDTSDEIPETQEAV